MVKTVIPVVAAVAMMSSMAHGGVDASGGVITRVGNDWVHTFTESGTLEVTQGGTVEVLVVGGGGGGGSGWYGGGGGGAGDVIYSENYSITSGSYKVTVGAGGLGGSAHNRGQVGEDSSVFDLVAAGGGYGGGWGAKGGGSGASGGGGSGDKSGWGGSPGSGTSGKKYKGGYGWNNLSDEAYFLGGCGGGAGGNGSDAYNDRNVFRVDGTYVYKGGDGVACSITGSEVYYGGGGAGGVYCTTNENFKSIGGLGGGGKGGVYNTAGQAGENGLGGGGGGGAGYGNWDYVGVGGKGGSGIVIIRYTMDSEGIVRGGRKTIDGDYEIHSFTGDGTLKVEGMSLVDVLVVGGGGGGGSDYYCGGGGGAGGVIYKQSYVVTSGVYQVTVGTGGAGGAAGKHGTNGGDSSIFDLVAVGGGYGGGYDSHQGNVGGSGGGGSGMQGNWNGTGGNGTDDQGYKGGRGWCKATTVDGVTYALGGGGGGAGGAGASAYDDADFIKGGAYGKGGDGIVCSITGTAIYYGGGGGGGGYSTKVTDVISGGLGGGGTGGYGRDAGRNGGAGTDGLGGGGGGASSDTGTIGVGGNGGSGVVIVRCRHIPVGMIISIR